MADKRSLFGLPLAVVVVCSYAAHIYEERQAYKPGVYIGKSAFKSEDLKNRNCLSLPADSPGRCEMNDLCNDAAMEAALASVNIPALVDSVPLHTGFRDGWRKARTAAFYDAN
jgi:hypothetical protein